MKKILSMICLSAVCINLSAGDVWVSPQGNDAHDGSRQTPKATLTQALRHVREMRRQGKVKPDETMTIHLMAGVHRVYEPLFVRPEDSGTPASPTVLQGEKGASVSGGVQIGGWEKKGKVWVADVPAFNGRPLDFRQLWVNGSKAVRARNVEDFEKMARILNVDNKEGIVWVPARSVQKILRAPYAEMVMHEMWVVSNLRIRSIDVQGDSAAVRFHNPEARLHAERFWPRPMVTDNGRNSAFYLTNARELLDQPGEWYHDIDARKLYYMPRQGEDLRTAEVVVPAVETLVQVMGDIDKPVHDIHFRNIAFHHATWMRPSLQGHVPLQAGMYMVDAYRLTPKIVREYNNHKLDNQGYLGRPASAVDVRYARNIDFTGCDFEHLGSTGLDYAEGVTGGRVEDCIFRDIAGNGLLAGSFSPMAYETHQAYNPADRRVVCTHQTVHNNLFTDIANEDWGCVAIGAGYVADFTAEHNEINDVSYTGISMGWGWTRTPGCMRNNLLRANLIYNYGKHMYDTAGIYTLGSQPNSLITENVVHSIYTPGYAHDPNHWFYLYTDEGSSNITVRNNWTEAEKFLQNANGPCTVWNNNGSMVADSIKARAGLIRPIKR